MYQKKATILIIAILLSFQTSIYGQGKYGRYEVKITSSLPKAKNNNIGNLQNILENNFRQIGFRCVFDESVNNQINIKFSLKTLPVTERIDYLLQQHNLDYELIGNKTIIVFYDDENKLNRKRFERVKVKDYDLSYLHPEDIKKVLPLVLSDADFYFLKNTKKLILKTSKLNHLRAKTLIESLDFERLVIELDVTFYEVSVSKKQDFSFVLNRSEVIDGLKDSVSFFPVNQSSFNNKNFRFTGKVKCFCKIIKQPR